MAFVVGGNDGVLEDGHSLAADVAGKDEALGVAFVVAEHLDGGAADDVPGVEVADLDAWCDFHALAEGNGLDELEDALDIVGGKEGLDERAALPCVALVGTLGVHQLEGASVAEHDAHEVARGGGCVDGLAVAVLGQDGEASDVVDVGVGDDDRVEGFGGDWGQLAVAAIAVVVALVLAKVDEDAGAARFDEGAGTGDFARGAKEREIHGRRVSPLR